jgi:hypothetical protein
MSLNSQLGVLRTAWLKSTTGNKKWRDALLIETNSPNYQVLEHMAFNASFASDSNQEKSLLYAFFFALINMSSLLFCFLRLGSRLVLAISFSLLLTRFLWTLFCPCLATIMPTRGRVPLEGIANRSNTSVRSRRTPGPKKRRISLVLLTLSAGVIRREEVPLFIACESLKLILI